MIIDRPRNNRPESKGINGIAVVNQFVFLGSFITNLGRCTLEDSCYKRSHGKAYHDLFLKL